LAKKYPHVHVVEPVPLGGEYGYYSGEICLKGFDDGIFGRVFNGLLNDGGRGIYP
jgi:hypothetical protein